MRADLRGGWVAAGVALVARLAVVLWAAGRFPASGDGLYYDVLARRLAEGHGYTWLWPDGAVTNVAHYPVGYPALLALPYAVFGAHPASAMAVNAVFGAAMAWGVYRLAIDAGRRLAMGAALAVALHPALVPYTAAVMTEGVAAALLIVAAAVVRGGPRGTASRRGARIGSHPWVLAGLTLGVATLVRPQCLVLAPLLGFLAPVSTEGWKTRARAAATVSALALATCAPWTARNCVAMHECALVSVNGGWNLLIGAQTTNGAWQPIGVPDECRTVWDEAAKDACFGRAARAAIRRTPLAWAARAPAKLAATLDYFGAGPWYLHEANGAVFGDGAKTALGVVETVVSDVVLLAALAGVALLRGPRGRARPALCGSGAVLAVVFVDAWIAYAALTAAVFALGPRWLARAPLVIPFTAILLLATMVTHAVFFGAGRYGLVVVPFVTALAFVAAGLRLRGSPSPPLASESSASSARSESPSSRAAA